MTQQYKDGSFVFIKSTKEKGKVTGRTRGIPMKYLVEVIKNFDKDTQERTTKLLTLSSEEISPYREKKPTKQRKPLQININIKYFDKEYPQLQDIAIGDLIDLRSRDKIEYKEGDSFIIPLGVAMEIPKGWRADVLPRSSTFKKWGIIQTNSVGKIDNSYSGDDDEWGMPVYALKDGVIEKYDRVCQFEIIKQQPKIVFNTVESLSNVSRGGFGSTGTK